MRTSRESGLTLVELLAALAVSALLAASALAVIVALPKSDAAGRRLEECTAPGSAWPALLAADVAHARLFRAAPGGFELRVHTALDPRTLEMRHLDAVVAWQVRRVGPGLWVVRTQRGADGRGFSELVSPGVLALDAAPAKGDSQPSADGWRAMPEALTVTAGFEAPGSVPAVFTFCSE